jgi:hypothetical protein
MSSFVRCMFNEDSSNAGPPGWSATSHAARRRKGLIPVSADTLSPLLAVQPIPRWELSTSGNALRAAGIGEPLSMPT